MSKRWTRIRRVLKKKKLVKEAANPRYPPIPKPNTKGKDTYDVGGGIINEMGLAGKNLMDAGRDKLVDTLVGQPKLPTPPVQPIRTPGMSQATHATNMANWRANLATHQKAVRDIQQKHQQNQQHWRSRIDNVTRPIKQYMGVAQGGDGYAPLHQLDRALRSMPGGQSLMGPGPTNKRRAAQVAAKAASLMPYINDNYAAESNQTRLRIAFNAAYRCLNNSAATEPSSQQAVIPREQPVKEFKVTATAVAMEQSNIPLEKQRMIDQIVNQLNFGPCVDGADDGKIMLLEQLHRVTPHLNDEQRKQLIPDTMYGLYDDMTSGVRNRDKAENDLMLFDGTPGTDKALEEKIPALMANLLKAKNVGEENSYLQKIASDLSMDEFELLIEALSD